MPQPGNRWKVDIGEWMTSLGCKCLLAEVGGHVEEKDMVKYQTASPDPTNVHKFIPLPVLLF
jgi:hypothetical protein